MIGIETIGTYLPSERRSNFEFKEKFEIDDYFISNKIGFEQLAVARDEVFASDLCVEAFKNLQGQSNINRQDIEAVVVVTQNPDKNIPHTSAIVHGKLDLSANCACFDVSLGCSGYVYGLSIVEGLMIRNGLKNVLLFTADPYSKIINKEDKNTYLLFGDGATVTHISENPRFVCGKFTFGTLGNQHEHLVCSDGLLNMNGRAIFDFAARNVPEDVRRVLMLNSRLIDDVDLFLFHQGSKYIVDTLIKRLRLPAEKVPFDAAQYGNTVSSSIPFMLNNYMESNAKTILLSGFGVGLSWASTLLSRV